MGQQVDNDLDVQEINATGQVVSKGGQNATGGDGPPEKTARMPATGVSQDDVGVHPRARAFFTEVAEARRARRRVMLEMDPESDLFRMATGAEGWKSAQEQPKVSTIPGEHPCAARAFDTTEAGPGIELDPSVASGPTTGRRFGLNAMHAYEDTWNNTTHLVEQATKYGADDQPFEDAARLGARVVRQHGGRDLFWGMVALENLPPKIRDQFGVAADVPLEADLSAAMEYGLDSSGNVVTNVSRLTGLLTAAHAHGVKLVFTFLTIGDGGTGTSLGPPTTSIATYDGASVEYLASDGSPASRIDFKGTVTDSFDDIPWSTDHLGQSSPSGAFDFPLSVGNPTTGFAAWFTDALDPSCPYKREYIGLIAARCAQMLLDAAAAATVDLADVVEAIEIFNEVDPRDCWENPPYTPDMVASGAKWGRAYLHAAWAFRSVLTNTDIKLWMPGIASYGDAKGRRWPDKLAYVDGFVKGMVAEADRYFDVFGETASTLLSAFPSLLQGVDLHWYHRREGEMLHIGYLVFEIEELRQAVFNAVATYNTEVDSGDFADFPVSVFESGWGLDTSKNGLPAGTSAMTADELESFQAAEVWRRIGGALAGNADIVSWHSWMSTELSPSAQFAMMGLRLDTAGTDSDAFIAVQRPAWFAYSLLSQLLGDRVSSGSMVLPRVGSRAELGTALAMDGNRAGAVVLEFRLDSGVVGLASQWAYLVLRDPSLVSAACLVVSSVEARPVVMVRHEIDYSATFVSSGTATALPVDTVIPAGSVVPLLGTLFVAPTWSPILYVSSGRLAWRTIRAAATSSVASSLHSIPDWMDDAGRPIRGGCELAGGLGGLGVF